MSDDFPSWEEWRDLKEDQRQYRLHNILNSMNSRLCDRDIRIKKLENRKWLDRSASFAGGIIGGFLAALGLRELK